MHIMNDPKKVFASAVISELQSSDIYLSLKARLFDLRANLNGVRVTEAFLDEIVENEAKYICQPLYADIRGLIASRTVGHMYNKRTGEFHSTQIGAFYRFEKEVDGDNAYLVGYARVPKRNKALCKSLSDLFTDNALKFSFELNCGVYEQDEDGTMVIDVDPKNYWEGECVVTFPACEAAVAQALIAECLGKGDENMADEKNVIAESEVVDQDVTALAETEVQETVGALTEIGEVANDAETVAAAEATIAELEASAEIAETVYVTQSHTEIDNTRAYNRDTGEEVEQRVVVETTVHTPVELAEDEAQNTDDEDEDPDDDDKEVASAEESVNASACTEDDDEPEEEDEKKEVAEAKSEWLTLIAELRDTINELRKEIAEIRTIPETAAEAVVASVLESEVENDTVIAESVTGDVEEDAPVNPFMASISAPKKYSLLDKEEKSTNKYALLERA